MGLSVRPVGKFKSVTRKIENELEAQKRSIKDKKENQKGGNK